MDNDDDDDDVDLETTAIELPYQHTLLITFSIMPTYLSFYPPYTPQVALRNEQFQGLDQGNGEVPLPTPKQP